MYATKEEEIKLITVRECKFRISKSSNPVTRDDMHSLNIKKKKMEENAKHDTKVKLNFWLVTNSDNFEQGVREVAESKGIGIRKAILHRRWEKRSD